MTEDRFWQLIEESRRDFDPGLRDGNQEHQRDALHALLSELPTDEVQGFAAVLSDVLDRAYRWDLWGAAFVIGSGCSDDMFDYFRYWLISMGATVYRNALADPESLAAPSAEPGVEDIFFEDFGPVVWEVLEERGVEPEPRPFPERPAGTRWKREDLPTLFPKLWSIYGEA